MNKKKEVEKPLEEELEEELDPKKVVVEDPDKDIDEDKVADEIGTKIAATLDLKGLREKISKLSDSNELVKRIFGADMSAKTNTLTKEEKIVAFFDALVRNDQVGLKALSEGTPADGGYLVPEEFRAELLRDLIAPTRMRSVVRVVPMKRVTLKIPKLIGRPIVTWTAENAAKDTTTASFDEKTLTAYKVAAILYALIFRGIKKALNSVNTLSDRTIPSQVIPVMV